MPYENGERPQVGDRVRVVQPYQLLPPAGSVGTVRRVHNDGQDAYTGVEFDAPMNGHDLGGTVEYGRGWNLPASHLDRIGAESREASATLQVGDRVRTTHARPDANFSWPPIGSEGTVVSTGSTESHIDFSEHPNCPSGSGRHWFVYNRYIEPAVDPTHYLIEIVAGEIRTVTGVPTFTDGRTAADYAKRLTLERGHKVQVRPIARDAGGDAWRDRERARLTDGTYLPMPVTWDLPQIPDHFLHLAEDDPCQVAFTESPQKGVLDRQTRMTPGRYLERFHTHLPDLERKRYIAMVDKPEEVFFATKKREIEWVYRNGPNSCMSHDLCGYSSHLHPVKAYAEGDFAVAYLKSGTRVSARCLVWPEKKIYGRFYGDAERLRVALETDGYKSGGYESGGLFAGARLRKLWDKEEERLILPYFDGGYYALDREPDAKTGFLEVFTGNLNTLREPKSRVYIMGGTNGFASETYRFCPKREEWHLASRFGKLRGTDEAWSRDALRDFAAQVYDERTRENEWWPRDLCTYIADRWIPNEHLAGVETFVSERSGSTHLASEKRVLTSGAVVSQDDWDWSGYTCAGSGLEYVPLRNRPETNQVHSFVDDRVYSRAWVWAEADRLGIDRGQAVSNIAYHGRVAGPLDASGDASLAA